ncbi:MFS transporter [Jatrophihabitans sp. DSM 45814]
MSGPLRTAGSPGAETRTDYRLTFVVLCAGVAAFALLQSLIIPVLTTVQNGLHTTQNAVTWVLTGYLLSASIFTPIVGRVGDMIGKRKMLVFTLITLAIGSVLAALATSIWVMLIARIIQGIGGGTLPLSFGIVRDEFPEDRVSGAIGTLAALASVGSGVGIAVAGPIVSVLNYHWLFWIPGIMVTAAALAAYFVVPESPNRAPGRIRPVAVLLMAGWLVALLIAVSEAPTWGWLSARVLILLPIAAILFVLWVWTEMRSTYPLIDMKMMRIPTVWTVNVVALLMGAGMYAAFAFTPEFIQTSSSEGYGFGASVTECGLLLLPQAITGFIFGIAAGWLTRTFGARRVLITALLVAVAAFVMLTLAHAHAWQVVVALTLLGAGFGAAFSGMSALIVGAVPMEQTGVASGMNANIRTIGGAIGSAVISSLITAHLTASGLPTESGYTHGFMLLAVLTGGAVLAAIMIPRMSAQAEERARSAQAMPHAELGVIAGGTLTGADSE